MKTLGIDVSRYQGDINWKAVKEAGVEFAILRAGSGYSNEKDTTFEKNYREAKTAGIKLGAYYCTYACDSKEAETEVNLFLDYLKGKQFEYPIFVDIEQGNQSSCANSVLTQFCETLEDAGYYTGIYSYASFLKSYVSEEIRKRYCTWVAHFGVSEPAYNSPYAIHQFTEEGRVNGISGNVDMNYCYEDFSTIKEKGYNGFKTGVIPDSAPVRTVLQTIRKGASGDLVTLAQTLLKIHGFNCGKSGIDGKYGADTEQAAKAFQSKNKLTADGIIGPETWKKLLQLN